MRNPHLLFAVLLHAACYGSGKPSSEEEGSASESAGVVAAEEVAVGDCAEVPVARRFHQMAWFSTLPDEGPLLLPVSWGEVALERGLVVFGGESMSTGALLHDLWLFDLTNGETLEGGISSAFFESTTYCRWHKLSGDVGFGLSRGSMSYVGELEAMILVGGLRSDGSDTRTTDQVASLSLRDAVPGMSEWVVWSEPLGDAEASYQVNARDGSYGGSEWFCQGDYSHTFTWDGDPWFTVAWERCSQCITSFTCHLTDCSDEAEEYFVGWCPEDPSSSPYSACLTDPYCLYGQGETRFDTQVSRPSVFSQSDPTSVYR